VRNNHIRTKWRYISFYPNTVVETWLGWQIEVKLAPEKATVVGWCMQQRTENLVRRWRWKPCRDPDILALVRGTVADITKLIKEQSH
jgi:hypothetical protein